MLISRSLSFVCWCRYPIRHTWLTTWNDEYSICASDCCLLEDSQSDVCNLWLCGQRKKKICSIWIKNNWCRCDVFCSSSFLVGWQVHFLTFHFSVCRLFLSLSPPLSLQIVKWRIPPWTMCTRNPKNQVFTFLNWHNNKLHFAVALCLIPAEKKAKAYLHFFSSKVIQTVLVAVV